MSVYRKIRSEQRVFLCLGERATVTGQGKPKCTLSSSSESLCLRVRPLNECTVHFQMRHRPELCRLFTAEEDWLEWRTETTLHRNVSSNRRLAERMRCCPRNRRRRRPTPQRSSNKHKVRSLHSTDESNRSGLPGSKLTIHKM